MKSPFPSVAPCSVPRRLTARRSPPSQRCGPPDSQTPDPLTAADSLRLLVEPHRDAQSWNLERPLSGHSPESYDNEELAQMPQHIQLNHLNSPFGESTEQGISLMGASELLQNICPSLCNTFVEPCREEGTKGLGGHSYRFNKSAHKV